MVGLRKLRAALLSVVIGGALCHGAAAQDANRDALFARMLKDPGNVTLALQYAKLSNEAGDIEAAIGALERILFFDPNEPNARLYLGMLYGKLGSYDMARGYFESVLKHPATPQAIKDRAAYLIGQADQNVEPSQFSGYVRTGLRWQSNANYDTDEVYNSFLPASTGAGEASSRWTGNPKSDWNAYVQGGLFYSYDFGNQRGDAFEASVTTYNTRQFDLDEFDFSLVEAVAGVRFGIPTSDPTRLASIKPYLIAGASTLEDDPYFVSGGVGIEGTVPVGTWTIAPYVQAVWREYDEDALDLAVVEQGLGSGVTGPVYTAGIFFNSDPAASLRFYGHLGFERREVADPKAIDFDADVYDASDDDFSSCGSCGPFSEDHESYRRFNAELRVPFDLYIKGHHLLVSPGLGFRYTKYDSPDPFTFDDLDADDDPIFVEREDMQFRFGVAFDYAVNDWAGVGAAFLYTTTDSNLSAYDIDNLSVSFGPHFRF